jgi:hypothetical protein
MSEPGGAAAAFIEQDREALATFDRTSSRSAKAATLGSFSATPPARRAQLRRSP